MRSRAEFQSAAFPKYPNESGEIVNQNCWGKRLAEFVRDTLPHYGVITEGISCEDWGWMVDLKHEAFPLWIGCGVMDEDDENTEEGDEEEEASHTTHSSSPGSPTEFVIFVTAEPGFFQKLFKKVDTGPAITEVVTALERMMADHPSAFLNPNWD